MGSRCSKSVQEESQVNPIYPIYSWNDQKAIAKQNSFRKMHFVDPLMLDVDLCKIAQSHAEKIAKRETFEYSKAPALGENIAMYYEPKPSHYYDGNKVVQMWYNEIKAYNFKSEIDPTKLYLCRHFTQMMWKSTKYVGFGVAVSKFGKVYAEGNQLGSFQKNILPKLK